MLVAFDKPLLGPLLISGLSLGILVIVSAWVLCLVYVQWANNHYDKNHSDKVVAAALAGQGRR
jgi:uncharacterized membrane protein (DUF485 family)